MLISFIVAACVVVVMVFYLHFCNKRNERRRVTVGKGGGAIHRFHLSLAYLFLRSEAKIPDYSMLTIHDAQLAHEETKKGGSFNTRTIGRQAFDDLTDLQNDEFIVSPTRFFLIFQGLTLPGKQHSVRLLMWFADLIFFLSTSIHNLNKNIVRWTMVTLRRSNLPPPPPPIIFV